MMYFNFIGHTQSAEFASRWKRELSPDSVAQGKATGKQFAQNTKVMTAGWQNEKAQNQLASGIKKGKKLADRGKQAMLTKAASPNRTYKPPIQQAHSPATPNFFVDSPKSKVKMPTGSIGDDVKQAMGSKTRMADDIAKGVGRNMLKKKLLVGAGLAAVGSLYAARKAKKERQQRPFKRLLDL